MENSFEVQAEKRTDEGKGASRRLRRAGKIPAIIYGGDKAPMSISLEHNKFLRHLQEEAFYAHILTINVEGKKEKAILKDLQRHPASDVKIFHADFLRVDNKHEVTMSVPLHFVGGDVAPGVKAGGKVSHLMTEVEISCFPKDLPEYIEVDLSGLELDGSIHLSELTLPEGVTIVALTHEQDEELDEGEHSTYDQAVANIHMPRGSAADDDEEAVSDTEEDVEE